MGCRAVIGTMGGGGAGRMVSSCGTFARAHHARSGALLRSTRAVAAHRSTTSFNNNQMAPLLSTRGRGGFLLPPTVHLGGGHAVRGGSLQHVRAYARHGDYDDDEDWVRVCFMGILKTNPKSAFWAPTTRPV